MAFFILPLYLSSPHPTPPRHLPQESQAQWPEDGAEWSDPEDGTSMDCGLLQAMAEEDEEINVYNEETFGVGVYMYTLKIDISLLVIIFFARFLFSFFKHILFVYIPDLDTQESTDDLCSGLLPFAKPPPTPPPDPKPPLSRQSSHSPPRQRARYQPQAPAEQQGRGRGYRRGLGRGQMFEDPAVIRIVQGRPSLKVVWNLFAP